MQIMPLSDAIADALTLRRFDRDRLQIMDAAAERARYWMRVEYRSNAPAMARFHAFTAAHVAHNLIPGLRG